MIAAVKGPFIDFAGLAPQLALFGGAVIVLLVGLIPARFVRTRVVPFLTLVAIGAAIGMVIWQFGQDKAIIARALQLDDFALVLCLLFLLAGAVCVILSLRAAAPASAGHGEYYALLLAAIAGMLILVEAQNLVSVFIGLELFSIALYVLCATEMRREGSLESGLKYLIIGSVGSATLLYGFALIYGATASTDFDGIARALATGDAATDPLLLTGVALTIVGLGFKASLAPFHQWTPDVYEGAPTPITAFMSVATKAAAFGIFLRIMDVALLDAQVSWGPVLAAIAVITIVVGNVGALGQSSLKRLLAWSSVAQAGYLLAGVVVATNLGIQATVFYLAVYAVMNLAAFAVLVARERASGGDDQIASLAGLGKSDPWLAWPLTIAMLSLAGMPATAGFIGKIYLIEAAVEGGYSWLSVVIVLGSAVSLAYYLKVVAAMWMPARGAPATARPIIAGGATDAPALEPAPDDAPKPGSAWEVKAVAVLAAAATVFFGIIPTPLFELAGRAGESLSQIL